MTRRAPALLVLPALALGGLGATTAPAAAAERAPTEGTQVYTVRFHAETFWNWKAEYSDREYGRRSVELNVDGVVLGATFIDGRLVASREGTNVFGSIDAFTEEVTNDGDTRTDCDDQDRVVDPTGFEPRVRPGPDGAPVLDPFHALQTWFTCTTREGDTVHEPYDKVLGLPGLAVPLTGLETHVGQDSFRLPLRGAARPSDCPGASEGDVVSCSYRIGGHVDFTRVEQTRPYEKPGRPRIEKQGRRASVQVGCGVDCAVRVEARPLRGSGRYATARTRLAAGTIAAGSVGLSAAQARRVRRDGGLRLVVAYTSDDAAPRSYEVVARL